jgi:hypothetical protein
VTRQGRYKGQPETIAGGHTMKRLLLLTMPSLALLAALPAAAEMFGPD